MLRPSWFPLSTDSEMPAKNPDLHGNAPDHSAVALVLIDMINDLEFPGGERLLHHALAAAERIAALKRRAREAGIPVIYANDNFGRWRSDFREVIEHCLHDGVRGQRLAEALQPDEEDYFVLKPKHSAFFSTTLETLLKYLGSRRLILTGITGDVCVLFTAKDAFMRDLELCVPCDCVASISEEENELALAYMRRVLHADTRASPELDLATLHGGGARGEENRYSPRGFAR
jgi:nicotinamidase-related amidase